ncbi:MAG TPA: hydroxyacid dehydrogenase [Polyangia bacterium]|nr:hydroxyacid dehydrogenase [Polyangia bacterium]
MARILLTNPPEMLKNFYGDRALEALRQLGEVRLNPLGRELSTPELIDAARDCTVIVSHRGVPAEPALFDALPDLVAFCRCAVDIRTVNVAAASARGVLVTHASAGFIPAVAEWIIGAMIDLGRHITASTATYHAGQEPQALTGRQLKGATVGVIGYGQIGRYLCDLGKAFGARLLVSDPYAQVTDPGVTQCPLPQLLAQSDFVVCLAVATDDTENLMNAAAFARMKPTAFFVNASRGNLVDEAALAQALDGGTIAGCALDVGRAPDQKPSMALARHTAVIATPHSAGQTPEAIEHQSMETVAQVAEILQGRIPAGAVNADQALRIRRLPPAR